MQLNDFYLSESEINQYFKNTQKINEEQYESKNQLQTIIENTLNLQYQIFLNEEELKTYKLIINQKQSQLKRLKDKLNKKNGKVLLLTDNLKKLSYKLQEVKSGYKKITGHNKQSKNNEQAQRSQRLAYQQKKTNLYRQYCDLQKKYQNILRQIQQYEQHEVKYLNLKEQNEGIQKQIDHLIGKKKQLNNNQSIDHKEHLKNEVKKIYQKIKITQKQAENITQEYDINRKAYAELQRMQAGLNNKNIEIQALYQKIEKVKEDIKLKKWEKTQKQRQFYEITRQQSELRKQMGMEMEYRHSQRKIKQNPNHNFKIIDSQADQQAIKISQNNYQNYNQKSQDQLDQLINRFQKIKSKPKNF